ncbi:MAG: hypothetical protein HY731_14305, partial [Candidatus Tectomicrobia bacterium]|nr:hypothetical protein [Candidatus Tectomicrobia bacterium]
MKTEVVLKDNLDRKAWKSLLAGSHPLREKTQDEVVYQDFLGDIHTSLLKPSPVVKPVEQVAGSRIPARTAVEEMLKTSDWRELHAMTQGDTIGAGLGTLALADQMLEALKQIGDPEKLANLERQMEQLQELAETLQEMNLPCGEQLQQVKTLQNKIHLSQEQILKSTQEQRDSVRSLARGACQKAQQEVQEAMEGISSWGSDLGKPVTLDITKSIELAHQLMS